MKIKVWLVGALLFLAGCAADSNPATTSHALSKTYAVVANTAAAANEQGLLPASAEACVKAADKIAFAYVNETNAKAQEWLKAGGEEQTILAQTIDNLVVLAKTTLADISRIIATKEC
jgi:hypothetical protein